VQELPRRGRSLAMSAVVAFATAIGNDYLRYKEENR
jgi:hypothetical protein